MRKSRVLIRQKIFYGILGCVIFGLIWIIFGHVLLQTPEYSQFYGFHPVNTLKAFISLIFDGFFWSAVVASLRRVFVGLAIACVVGIPFGILIGFYDKFWLLTYTPIQFIRMISPLSWMPIAILIAPTFEEAIYFLISMACVWPMVINTAQGVNRINRKLLSMARNQGASDPQLVKEIIIPSALPNIIIGFRLALGISWIVLVPAEFLGISSGLGYSINDARDTLEYDRLLALVFAIGCIGFLLDGAVKLLEKKSDLRYILRSN